MKWAIAWAGVLLAACSAIGTAAEIDAAETAPTFERDVRPILKAHCFHCHGEAGEHEGGLDLRLRRLMVQGGDSGAAIVPGNREDSYLLARIIDGDMPPGDDKQLSQQEIAIISRWIESGAQTARPEPEEIGNQFLITEEDREFWSFQPIRRPAVPQVRQADQVRNPIDAFLLARLEEQGLGYVSEADRRTLIRRASFDLIGLPPTPAEVDAFLSDDAPGAYERLIDRLLASPQYGERWGRHWLDVAGYADSEGYTSDDPVRNDAYKYRDYVIRSLNADQPFDQFIQEQLAGDEMLKPPYKNLEPDEIDKLTATGFLRMAPDGTAGSVDDVDLARNQTIADTVEIVSTSLLGLTVACAQCHHHRYDPISHHDYYSFRAIFEPAFDWKNWRKPQARRISLYTDADRERAKQIDAEAKEIDRERTEKQNEYIERTFNQELDKLEEELREPIREARNTPAKDRTPEQKKLLKEHPSVNVTAGSLYLYDRKAADELKEIAAKAAALRETKPKEEFVRALTEVPGRVPPSHLFARGDHEQPQDELPPAELTVVRLNLGEAAADLPANDPSLPTTGRRLAYARKLTDGTHPLTARVLVNRVWLHHFGRGIVNTPGDFGLLGERPSHPELLDWLAGEFMDQGWSLKRLHKLIMMSAAYQQELRRDPHLDVVDPGNRLYAGMPLRRLEAEALRDAILSVSGRLNPKPFGPAVPVMADLVGQWVIGIENLNAGRPGAVLPMHGEEFRRSVYVQVRRSRPLAVLDTFDAPPMDPNCEVRATSTVAPQALMLMNSEFIVEQSNHFARRLNEEAGDEPAAQVARAWNLAFAQDASDEEIADAVEFLAALTEQFSKTQPKKDDKNAASPQQQALAAFCQTLLSSNAFLYID
jgi:mono/diheme cytochrome c family protein